MDVSDIPEDVVVVDWGKRTLYQRGMGDSTVLSVRIPPSPVGSTDLFRFCCAIAIAQQEAAPDGAPTAWTGADHPFLDRVTAHFGWQFGLRSRFTYWSDLPRSMHNDRMISHLALHHLDHEIRAPEDEITDCARRLFNHLEGFVLGEPRAADPPGTCRIPRIEFRSSKTSSDDFERFRTAVVDLLSASWEASPPPRQALPASLHAHYLCFDSFIAERTNGFVGRRFVFDAIQNFINSTASGYFIIRGLPGIGKSACLARFVLDRELPVHHFNIAPEGITSPGKFIGNVASRLVERYGLTCPSLPSDFDTSGVLLRQLLDQAAPRTRADNPLVIAIDALDEVDATLLPPGANHLFLPTALPAHVYVVATCRSGARVHLEVAVAESFAIEVHSDAHQRDVREYLEAQLEVAAIRRWMAGHNVTESEFVQRLLEKSEGNFMYLHYVLPALQHDGTIEGALADLPQGLLDYYRRHWSTMRSRCREEFECVYRPVLCVLAAFGDAVPLSAVARVTGFDLYSVSRVMREWQEFFDVLPGTGQEACYRIYHDSFRDFLQEDVDPGLQEHHRMIADSILRRATRGENRDG